MLFPQMFGEFNASYHSIRFMDLTIPPPLKVKGVTPDAAREADRHCRLHGRPTGVGAAKRSDIEFKRLFLAVFCHKNY